MDEDAEMEAEIQREMEIDVPPPAKKGEVNNLGKDRGCRRKQQ